MDLSSKVIVITGAASGIGKATSILLSKLGAKVILIDISEDGLDKLTSELYGDYKKYVVDLSKIDSVSSVSDTIYKENGVINGLVHCAGISSRKPLNVLKKDGFSKVMDVNFFSFVELVKQFSKKGRLQDGGSIVAMSSISSIKGYRAKTEYCVSKASLDAFVRCMALELSGRKIRINTVMPAVVNTPMASLAKELNLNLGSEDFNSPLGPTDPIEVANLIAFLLTDLTKTITGTSILIDGGATI